MVVTHGSGPGEREKKGKEYEFLESSIDASASTASNLCMHLATPLWRLSATFCTDATLWLHVHLHSLLGHSMPALLSGTWGPLVYHNYWPTSLLSPRKKGTNIPGARSRLGDFAMLQAPVQRVGLLPVATYKSRSLSVFLVSALEM